MSETWLILGASSSISRAFALRAAAAGCAIVLAGRDLADLQIQAADIAIRHGVPVEVRPFDASETAGHGALARDLDARERALNVFAAFGTMPRQAAAEADPALAVDAIAVNFAGMVSILLHLAPLLERRRCGRVVVLGSVAGDRGRLSNYVYGSTKAGLHAFLQGLRARLARAGVGVTTVKPGFTDTAMTWGVPGMFLVASPEAVAERCFDHAVKGTEEIYAPAFWRLIMSIIRAIPEHIFKRLNL